MWELPVYLFVAPILTIIVSLISAIKLKKYFFAPILLFVVFNIPTIIMPIIYNIGWRAILGWAVFYTVISLLISFIVWSVRRKKVMKSVLVLILLTIVVLPFGFFYVLNNGNPYTKFIADKKVPKYLEEKGYTEPNIEESHYVEPKNLINKDLYHGHYMVTFKDEPDITYYYGITKRGKRIKQFCDKDKLSSDGVTYTVEGETEHSEDKCINSLDNRD